jgi:hypothetical protein
MVAPLPSSTREFDLTAEARRVDRIDKYTRVVLGSCAAVFAALGLWIVLTDPATNPTATNYFLGGFIMAMAGCFVAITILRRQKAPLSDLKITSNGVELKFEDGFELEQRWDNPQFGLTLRDYAVDRGSTKEEKRHVVLIAPGKRFGTVQHDVASLLVQAAQAHSLPVVGREERVSGGKVSHLTLTTRIGRIEGTPAWPGR